MVSPTTSKHNTQQTHIKCTYTQTLQRATAVFPTTYVLEVVVF